MSHFGSGLHSCTKPILEKGFHKPGRLLSAQKNYLYKPEDKNSIPEVTSKAR